MTFRTWFGKYSKKEKSNVEEFSQKLKEKIWSTIHMVLPTKCWEYYGHMSETMKFLETTKKLKFRVTQSRRGEFDTHRNDQWQGRQGKQKKSRNSKVWTNGYQNNYHKIKEGS